ncbi:MAG: aspartate kinase [Promethearchaeota archaeon]
MSSSKVNIFKFGGSCLLGPPSFSRVVEIIESFIEEGPIVTVTSALNGVTDILLELANAAITQKVSTKKGMEFLQEIHYSLVNEIFEPDLPEKERTLSSLEEQFKELEGGLLEIYINGLDSLKSDFVVHFGERLSTTIFSNFLKSKGFNATFLPGDEIIETSENYGNALPHMKKTRELVEEKLQPLLSEDKSVVCVPGFYGATKYGNITTLGRGGSDFSATIVANCLMPNFSPQVTFWKDVDGLLSANPKLEPNAKLLDHISYAEAKELAFYGSKVLHPLCLMVLEENDIPAVIRSFHRPFAERFSRITSNIEEKQGNIIKAITALEKIAMVTVESQAMVSLPGTAARLFGLMGNSGVNISFISQSSSENNITFTTNIENSGKVQEILKGSKNFGKRWFNIKVDEGVSLVAVVGAGMLQQPGIAGRVFTSLGNARVNVIAIAQGSSEMNISFIIKRDDLKKAIRVLHSEFIA